MTVCSQLCTRLLTECVSVWLSQVVVDAGAVPLLIVCLQEPELALKPEIAL